MLVRVNEGLIRRYKPVLVDSQEAKSIVDEIMERSKTEEDSRYERHKYYEKIFFKLHPDGYSQVLYLGYDSIYTETFTTPAPYSLKFAAQCLLFYLRITVQP